MVSFGTFGIIAALAVETTPIYQLEFGPIVNIPYAKLKEKLNGFGSGVIPPDLYHYEFIFDPFSTAKVAMEASAPKVPYLPGVKTPKPRWIIRDKRGYAPGITILRVIGPLRNLLPPRFLTGIEYKQYRKNALLNKVRGSPGQLYTSSIYYLGGYIESAFGVSVKDAAATIDIASQVSRDMGMPSIYQVRLCRASTGTLAFTQHEPITAVFELGMINDERFAEYERRMDTAFRQAGIRYTMHWSKNSGIDPTKIDYMYGAAKITSWKAARRAVFGNDQTLMKLFETHGIAERDLYDPCTSIHVGAWILAAGFNASLTWWGVSVAIANNGNIQGTAAMSSEFITKAVPVFVAFMVCVVRLLIIGTFSLAGERLFTTAQMNDYRGSYNNQPRPQPQQQPRPVDQNQAPRPTQYNQPVNQPVLRPASQINRPVNAPPAQNTFRPAPKPVSSTQSSFIPPEPTYHPVSFEARSPEGSERRYDA